ncbi:MAG: hypothetical protein GY793_01365 [Proteobacteria bacterium]|nr:hypothetical protein [Pseudomonadota bacterium]
MVFESHPKTVSDLLSNITRMGKIADIIVDQEKKYNEHDSIPLGARILKVRYMIRMY